MIKRALIVDDELLIRRALGKAFRARGWEVSEAGSAEEALKELAERTFDLCVVDVIMPGLSGIEMVRTLPITVRQKLCVVFISAFPGSTDFDFNHWGQAFIAKPFEDLFETVRELETVEHEFRSKTP